MRRITPRLAGANYEVKEKTLVESGQVGVQIEIESEGRVYHWTTPAGPGTAVNREELVHIAKLLAERAAWLDLEALAENRIAWLSIADEATIEDLPPENEPTPHLIYDSPTGKYYFCKSGVRHSYDSAHVDGFNCHLCREPLLTVTPTMEQWEQTLK